MVRTPLIAALFGLSMGGFIALCTTFAEVVLRGATFSDLLQMSPAMWVIWSMPLLLALAIWQIAAHSAARERPVPWARPVPAPPIPVATLAAPPPPPVGIRTVSMVVEEELPRPKTIHDDGLGGVGGDERLHTLTDQVRVLRDQAERGASAARAKNAWLASLAPDLRARLARIIGDSALLADGSGGDPGSIERAGRELAEVLTSVIDLSRIEIGELSLVVEEVDLGLIVDEVRALVTPLAAERRIAFSARVDPQARFVLADPLRTRQVVLELVTNAIDTTFDGQVHVVVERATPRRDAWVAVHVKDTSAGLDDGELARAFDPYRAAEPPVATGLAISRALAELMGGRIDVQSDKGIGSTFTLLLPPPAVTPEGPPRRTGIPLHERLGGVRVLYVDGDPAAPLVARALAAVGLDVRAVATVAEARASFGLHRPQIVVVDTELEEVGPFMEDLVLDGVRIVATALRDQEEARARALGVRAVLFRPLDARTVIATIDRCIEPSPTSEVGSPSGPASAAEP